MIEIVCHVANPGHFFAACGLFELAHRLAGPAVLGRFGPERFVLDGPVGLPGLIGALKAAPARALGDGDEEGGLASPILLGAPFGLRLDWWTHAKDLKVWAGSMDGPGIFRSMVAALPDSPDAGLLNLRGPVADADQPSKKKEPFYFDARRGEHADPRDIGFSPNAHDTRTAAAPAVEALTLIGLQRFRPRPTDAPRVYTYNAWTEPLGIRAASAVVSTALAGAPVQRFRFESAFRTSQRKHKAFMMASPIPE